MKKRFCYYLLILTILGGCASLQAKREVLENTFYSSYPEIQIKIGSEFEYIGETKEAKKKQAQDSTYTATVRKNWYIFAQSEAMRVRKVVLIEIKKAPTYWVSDIYGRVENYYDKGTCKLAGLNWQYCSVLIYSGRNRLLNQFATEHGYMIPRCLLAKYVSKIYGPKNNYLVTIIYAEEPPTSDYGCHNWKPNIGLAHSQREYLEQFKKNSETSFKILKSGF